MKKKELIRQIAKNQGNSILETQYWTNIVLEELKKALIDDGEVDLYGFGKFTRVKRKGRNFYHDVHSGKMIDQPMVDAYVTINSTTYAAEKTLTVPKGTEITVTVGGNFAYGTITMNGTSVGTVSSTSTTYTFQATDNVLIAMESLTYMYSADITMPYTG